MRAVGVVGVLCVLCSLVLLCAAPTSGWAAPTIQLVDIRRAEWDYDHGMHTYYQYVYIYAQDAKAAAINTVVVESPDGQTAALTPAEWPEWYLLDEENLLVRWTAPLDSPVLAPYNITVYTEDGSDTATSPIPPAFLPRVHTVLYPLFGETQPLLQWSSTETASYSMGIREEAYWADIWRYRTGEYSPGLVELPYDGPALLPGYVYGWWLQQYRDAAPDVPGDPRFVFMDLGLVFTQFAVYDPALAGITTPSLPGKLVYGYCCAVGVSEYNRDPNVRTWVSRGTSPLAWSPDGAELLCYGPRGDLWVDRADGSDASPVAGIGLDTWWDASWSPDGARLVVTDRNGSLLMAKDGSDPQALMYRSLRRRAAPALL